ncbi:hypothetical protein PG997_009938 [Apiospora hydei]|uniref:GED domain-containing protein n=1 Tax=Apiospora hydei TaxID=1337664 RepID=A0ABR1VYL7_9PEZI
MSPPTNTKTKESVISRESCYVGKFFTFLRSSNINKYLHLSHVATCDDQLPGHDLKHIAAIRKWIKHSLDECETRLNQMGRPRSSLKEMRAYLVDFSKRFTGLLQDALKEDYSGPFLTEPLDGDEEEATHTNIPLLVAIREHLKDFSKRMNEPEHAQTVFTSHMADDKDRDCTAVCKCEHSEITNYTIIRDILKRKMCLWTDITDTSNANTSMAAQSVVQRILNHLVGEDDAHLSGDFYDNVMVLVADEVSPPFEMWYPNDKSPRFTKVVETVLLQHQNLVIRQRITAYLGEENVNSGRYNGTFELENLIDCVLGGIEPTKADIDKSSAKALAEQVVDDYCKTAVQKFINDFIVNIELFMVRGLGALFTPDVVAGLSDEKIYEIARESEDRIRERQDLEDKMDVLRKTEALLCQLQDENRGFDA